MGCFDFKLWQVNFKPILMQKLYFKQKHGIGLAAPNHEIVFVVSNPADHSPFVNIYEATVLEQGLKLSFAFARYHAWGPALVELMKKADSAVFDATFGWPIKEFNLPVQIAQPKAQMVFKRIADARIACVAMVIMC